VDQCLVPYNMKCCFYEVCFLQTRTTKLTGATLTGEIACQNILYSALRFQKLLFQFFFPISHLIGCSRSAVHHSLLIPSKSSSWRFREVVWYGQKSLRGFRKLSGRYTMTRSWWEGTYKGFSIGEGGKTVDGGGESEIPEREGFHYRYQGQSGEWPVG
jgi:hypothetical protein